MVKHLKFGLAYSLRTINRHRQRSLFALFSIAAGVATIVALRILGLMLTDALTVNAKAFLRADILIAPADTPLRISLNTSGDNGPLFDPQSTARLDDWAQRNGVEITYRLSGQLLQVTQTHDGQLGQSGVARGYFIQPSLYPFYDTIRPSQPSDVPLAALLKEPNVVVVGQRLAEQVGIKVGDKLKIGIAPDLQTVTGIVPETSESNLDNPYGIAFSFVYLNWARLDEFGIPAGSADRAYLRLPPGSDAKQFDVKVYREWRQLIPSLVGKHVRFDTVDYVVQRNGVIINFLSRSVLLFSLLALVIGGIGIIETMFVAVNRRANEIAILKTVGLKRRDIAQVFLVEAGILGILGSALGLVLGILLSLLAKSVGEYAFAIPLPWHITADPLIFGLALGIGASVLFSLLPALSAAQIRPAAILHQGSVSLVNAGFAPTLFSVSVLVFGIGSLVDLILGSPGWLYLSLGIAITIIAFVVFAAMGALLWVLVSLLGHLPHFRSPMLKLAIGGLGLHRLRTVFSLLALIIGMAALSGTLILSRSIGLLLYSSIAEPLGGNVLVIPLLPLAQASIHHYLDNAPGVSGYRDIKVAQADLLAINGDKNFRAKLAPQNDLRGTFYLNQLNLVLGVKIYGTPSRGRLLAGRFLTDQDAGQHRIVIPFQPLLVPTGIGLGSTFTYRIGNTTQDFQVIGMVAADEQANFLPFSLGDGAVQAPIDVVPQDLPFNVTVATVQKVAVNNLVASMNALPGIFVLDISSFDSIINRVLNQMTALPLLIAALALFAAGILIATSVSLATMERRRQIGTVKALGASRWQALGQLLIENGLIGLLGGVISLLPTMLIIRLVPVITDEIVDLPIPLDLILIVIGLSIAITVVATLLTAWSASAEKPIRALRYE